MALSMFIDALPYNEIMAHYHDRFADMQVSELLPNIAYSSSLHWQLYCDKYPDDRGVLVDWVKEPESRRSVRWISALLSPLDRCGDLGVLAHKVLDRVVYRRNTFANIPFRLRRHFTQKGKYLFWHEKTYRAEPIFDGYTVVSQDEGHKSFEATAAQLEQAITAGDRNIFAVFGFADALGHKCRRGETYSRRLKPYMERVIALIHTYRTLHPEQPVLLVSDHGMSTVERKVDLALQRRFGKQSPKTYIAYCDTAVMCIWAKDETLKAQIADYLATRQEGHLLTAEDRRFFGAESTRFGDLIYILREGNVFAENWFGKSLKKPSGNGSGMHGFWPERSAKDQMACIVLLGSDEPLPEKTDYKAAHRLITRIMKGE